MGGKIRLTEWGREPKLGTRNSEPGTSTPKPETLNSKLEMLHHDTHSSLTQSVFEVVLQQSIPTKICQFIFYVSNSNE